MIIPERLQGVMAEATRGQMSRLPHLQRFLILKYCLNSKETFSTTFPFLAEEDDLDTYNSANPTILYIHVKDLAGHMMQRQRGEERPNPIM